MTPFEKIAQIFINYPPASVFWLVMKMLFLLAFLIYIAFAAMVIRQIGLMAKTLNTDFAIPIKLIAWVHLAMVILVFLLALVIL